MAPPPPLPTSLLRLPYFLLAVTFFYWSTAVGCLLYRIKFLSFARNNDSYAWALLLKQFMGVRVVKLGPHSLYAGGRCVYLCNHRSWADFFLDVYLTQARAAPMSRTLVFFAFPIFMAQVVILKGIILFKRGVIADKKKFNSWLDHELDTSPQPSLLVYPEGHRSTRPTSLPLKRGMLYYAHSRGLPVQVVITSGKERVLSEKALAASFGQVLVTSFSPVIQSQGVKDFEEFAAEVQRTWDSMWSQVYSADPTGLPPLNPDSPPLPTWSYPGPMRRKFLVTAVAAVLLLLLVIRLTLGAGAALLAPFSAGVQVSVVGGLLALFIASFITSMAKTPAPVPAPAPAPAPAPRPTAASAANGSKAQ